MPTIKSLTMKNIIIVVLLLVVSAVAIYFSLNYIDDKYQSAIAVAISTAAIQLVLFFLKHEFDSNSHKNTKSYGVVYDKKFIIYNNIIEQIVDARSYFVHFIKLKDLNNQEELFNKIEDVKRTILKNRIILSNSVFMNVNNLYGELRANYDKYIKALLNDQYYEATHDIDVEEYITGKKLNIHIFEILDIMRKELNVF